MKKVLLTTILWFISIAVFAQTEPTKYLIKYLETNTAQPDYGVTFLSDTQFIYKSPNTDKINTNSAKQSESNLFIATFDDNGGISDKKQIQGMPTNKVTKTGATYSPDKKTVYFSAKKFRKKSRRNDREQLFKADVNEEGNWVNIEKLPFSKDSHSYGEPSLSADGLELYFTTDMPGTLGGADIFKVGITSTGKFGQPTNLGNSINTSGNEVTPYITKENKLYFSSDNHKGGLGNLDVYCLDLKNPAAKPVHLDAPINSINDDFAFIINNNKKRGYFSSNRLQGQNNHDIFSFLVEEVKKEGPCLQEIAGIVRDNETKEVVPNALIKLYDDDLKEIKKTETDVDGKYSLTLDCNKTYTLTAGGNNYNTEDHIVNTANYLEAPTLEANKFLIKKSADEIETEEILIAETEGIKEGVEDVTEKEETVEETMVETSVTDVRNDYEEEEEETVAEVPDNATTTEEDEATITPVYFDFDRSTISQKSARELVKLSQILKNNKTIHVELSAYTDSRGSSAYNIKLSERRAQASADYLVAQGIDRSRIVAKGYGESKMVNKCIDGIECSEAAHEKNRRTEFAFINPQASVENFDNTSKAVTTNYEEVEEEEEEIIQVVETSVENNNEEIESNTSESVVVQEIKMQEESSTESNFEKADGTKELEVASVHNSSKKDNSNNTLKNKDAATASLNESNNTSGKNEAAKSSVVESKNEEETLSDEAKWLNNQIEESEAENKAENNLSTGINKDELSNEVANNNKQKSSTDNQQKKQLIDPITDTSKNQEYDKLVTTAKSEEKKEPKFNFEKESTNKPKSNTDPNQLLAELKAKREAEKANSPDPITNTNNAEEKTVTAKIPIIKKEAMLSTAEVSVRAMQSKRGKYIETDRSSKVNALRVTFRIKPNSHSEKGYKDAYVVIKSPTGKVVNEKGVFPLADGEDQAYTDDTTIYYNKQSIKAVMFIDKIVHKFSKGVYTVNIFIDGVEVGENIIRLS